MSTVAPPQPAERRPSAAPPIRRGALSERQRSQHPAINAFGNQLVQRQLKADRIQAQSSLRVTDPDDELEREADTVADTVMRMPDSMLPQRSATAAGEAVSRQVDEEDRKRVDAARMPPKPAPPLPKTTPTPKLPTKAPTRAEPKPPEKLPAAAKVPPVAPPLPSQAEHKRPEPAKPEPPKPDLEERKREEEPGTVAAKAAPGRTPRVTPAVASTLQSQHGAGRPLSASDRSFFEPRLGRDLGAVRLHDDSPAARTASDLGARAFTHGADVYFSHGAHRPGTAEGRRLLAHELVHTVQQRPGPAVRREPLTGPAGPVAGGAIQRTNGTTTQTPPAGGGGTTATPTAAAAAPVATRGTDTLTFPTLEVPRFRIQAGAPRQAAYQGRLQRAKGYSGTVRQQHAKPPQAELWEQHMEPHLTAPVSDKIAESRGGVAPAAGERCVIKSSLRSPARYFVGTVPELARAISRPPWDRGQTYHGRGMDVDHILELQLANFPTDANAHGKKTHDMENFELLDANVNQDSGRQIDAAIQARFNSYLASIPATERNDPNLHLRSWDEAKANYSLIFERGIPDPNDQIAYTVNDHWEPGEIQRHEHFQSHLQVGSWSELGGAGNVLIFQRAAGGIPATLTDSPTPTEDEARRTFISPMRLVGKTFNTGDNWESTPDFGSLQVRLPANQKGIGSRSTFDFKLGRVPGARYAGYLNKQAAKEQLESKGIEAPDFSPIEFDEVDFTAGGLLVEGRIVADLPLIRGSAINFRLLGTELTIYKAFGLGDFQVPRPLKITNSSLILSISTSGDLAVAGRVDLEIERLGRGFLGARAGTVTGFALEGGFDFDTKMFTEASIRMRYENRELSGEGTLGIGPRKIPGIRSARIQAAYAQERITAQGTADLSIPGVESGAMTFSYSEAEGMAIGGTFQLSNRIPGIRGGSVQARVAELPDRSGYSVTAHGEAQPAIPGVDARLTVDYADGAITITGRAAYSRGFLSGELEVGATNRPVDPAGNPLPDAAPTDNLTAFGGGQVTVRMTPWLQGTVGVRLLGNGEIEISGEIGLPASLEVFPRKSYDRNIFTIGLDIPIVGVAVVGQRIGIFATIQGGLDFSAGVGPGTLQQLRVGITYNPAHEDQTHLMGDAEFVIPADAGLRLFVRGGLGAGIPIVSATAGLELGGRLGLEGAARAGVHLDWTPTTGLVLDALGEIFVEPRFRFDVTGFVLVEADLLFTTIELYSKRWELAALEYGSGLRLGLRFPIHYQEGQPFDLDWNRVEFQIPDVDPQQVLTGLIEQIT